jgi:arginase
MGNNTILTPYFLDEALPGLEQLSKEGWVLNKPDLPEGEQQARMSVLHTNIAAEVESSLRAGDRPVSIAGDCCTAIAVTAGIQHAGIEHRLIWFDAHGDFNTWQTSPSGFLGGMPLAMLVGRGEQTLLDALAMQALAEDRVIFTDGRDLDPLERLALEQSAVVHLKDPNELLRYELPDYPLHIHFDTDILDPETAPAMNYFAAGGPDLDQLKEIFQHLAATEQVLAVSLSSWNPDLDRDRRTQRACMKALEVLLGV